MIDFNLSLLSYILTLLKPFSAKESAKPILQYFKSHNVLMFSFLILALAETHHTGYGHYMELMRKYMSKLIEESERNEKLIDRKDKKI